MKRVLLVMFVSALLVTFGFAQTPDAGSSTVPVNVKGCLGGSDGNYTVVEDGTRQTIKIATSAVDLKPHLGHDVTLIGSKAGADSSFAVTELNMISEHCAAAAAPAATVIPPSDTVIAPDPATTPPPATASAPPADATAPAAATATAPIVDAAAPVSPSAVTVTTAPAEATATVAPAAAAATTIASPAAEAVPAPRPSAHARKVAAAQAAASAPDAAVAPSTPAATPAADVTTPAPTASPSAEAVRAADAAPSDTPAAPAPAATHRASSLPLLVTFVVLVIVLGTMAPLIGRWRKRKMLERDGSPNLSFTNDEVIEPGVTTNAARSDQKKPEPRRVA